MAWYCHIEMIVFVLLLFFGKCKKMLHYTDEHVCIFFDCNVKLSENQLIVQALFKFLWKLVPLCHGISPNDCSSRNIVKNN